RIGPADTDRDIACGFPVLDVDGIDCHILHGKVAGLALEEQHARQIGEGAQLGRLANASRTREQDLHTARLIEPFIGGNDLSRVTSALGSLPMKEGSPPSRRRLGWLPFGHPY